MVLEVNSTPGLEGVEAVCRIDVAGRIIDCKSKVVITADEGLRGGRKVPLKANVDDALTNPETASVQKIIVVKRTGSDHAPTFTVEAVVQGYEPATATGKSRQEAEKAAAVTLLKREGVI